MAKHTRVYPDRTGEVASAPYTLVPARERRRRVASATATAFSGRDSRTWRSWWTASSGGIGCLPRSVLRRCSACGSGCAIGICTTLRGSPR